jgi:hypothetical protein
MTKVHIRGNFMYQIGIFLLQLYIIEILVELLLSQVLSATSIIVLDFYCVADATVLFFVFIAE